MAAHRVILLKFGTEVLTGSPELLMIKAESDWTNGRSQVAMQH